jgi:hypothetical protein
MKKPFAYPLAVILICGDTILALIESAFRIRIALPSSRPTRDHI